MREKVCLWMIVLAVAGCNSYPRDKDELAKCLVENNCPGYPSSEKEIDECLQTKGAYYSYCTQKYLKEDEARARKAKQLERLGPNAIIEIMCTPNRVVRLKIKDIKGNECQCIGTKVKRSGCY